jgi:hypothetical protein
MISCLMPTYNRFPAYTHLIEEAIYSFILQVPPAPERMELIICNDTPGQILRYDHPQVKIFNLEQRFPTLSDKLIWMIGQAQGDLLCRWDDDDIHLPWRLSTSLHNLNNDHGYNLNPSLSLLKQGYEWRPANHWYAEYGKPLTETVNPGNTHNMSLWRREVLEKIGGYPPNSCGGEDQEFNARLRKVGLGRQERLLPSDIFYIYRWGYSDVHLSGTTSPKEHWTGIGKREIVTGNFYLSPFWSQDWVGKARAGITST